MKTVKDYDDSIAFLGQWGLFQKVVFFLICITTIPNGFGCFAIVFLTDAPRHRCLIPDVNLSREWRDVVIPMEVVNGELEPSRCSRFRLDLVRNLSAQGLIPGRDVDLGDLEQEGCVDGWSYSTDVYQSTVVSQFDLVCAEQWKQPLTSTIFFMGILVGSFFSGQISDRFGRKPVLFATIGIQMVFTLAERFAPTWTLFCVFLFINGLGQISNYVACFVLGSELLTNEVRVAFSSLGICLCFALGYMILPLWAYFLRDWKDLLLALSLPLLVYFPLWWFIPESPRWLLSQGRLEEAEAVVRKAAEMNKVEAPVVIFEDYRLNADDTKTLPEEHHTLLDLLKTRNIRNTTLIMSLAWVTMSTGYYGMSLNTSSFHDNPYISCFISAAVEVPAYFAFWLVLRCVPRRRTVIGILLIGAAALFVIQLVPRSLSVLSFALEMVGKFVFTIGMSIVYVYTAEIYPTALRTTATGLFSTFAKMGTSFAPFLLQLSLYFEGLPQIVLGMLTVVCAFTAFFLPESFGRPLPQTIKEMQKTQSLKCPFTKRREHSKPADLKHTSY